MFDKLFDATSRDFLDLLETKEHELLAWGAVDVGFTIDELQAFAHEVLARSDGSFTSDELIEYLLTQCWLFEVPHTELYRTRFAEGVRLFAKLKQTFGNQDWRAGTDLIADFQVMIEKRSVADRNRSPESLIKVLKSGRRGLDGLEEKALSSLLSSLRGLGKFQIDATREIRENLRRPHSQGVIVCAGTGTGKSLAFYLPCLTEIALRINADRHWAQCLAIYPRSVLLADQFASAFENARLLDGALKSKRKLKIGAFYGSTPSKASVPDVARVWKPTKVSVGRVEHPGYVFPTMRCPKCDGPLVWFEKDIVEKKETLNCIPCRFKVRPDEIVLTRERMNKGEPPDILFTTTEMLHKEMCSGYSRHTFLGSTTDERPYLMLLDEVHTYSGTSGALAALVIRRWRRLVGSPVQFVGLSATLADAEGFFAQFVGLPPHAVRKVTVEPSEVKSSGREYRLVLRSNPVTGAGLLSTSIQSSMLMARLLNPMAEDLPKDTAYPPKLFVFTDDLDVNNRMFDDLLDAEGYHRRTPVGWKQPLACLRRSTAPDEWERFVAGQSWRLPEGIGYSLEEEPNVPRWQRRNLLRIGRTSSQDPDVDVDNQVVVATAALEVGYDDHFVGAVLQHKSPQSSAAFLQRKGRAGRNYGARPWTVVVLSDFGRDRITYQWWDQLFNPELKRPQLPISNRYVLKMQAVAATLDWLYLRLTGLGQRVGNVWMALCLKTTKKALRSQGFCEDQVENFYRWNGEEQRRIADRIAALLSDPSERTLLRDHLKQALDISADEALALMWESPRALMTAVLPTAYRQLDTGWGVCGKEGFNQDYQAPNHPLPEFMSKNLFSDLNMPEVAISVDQGDPELIAIGLAMKETCPGRVTRRFASGSADAAHWVPPPTLEAGSHRFPIEDLCDGPVDGFGTVDISENGQRIPVQLVRLRSVRLSRTPQSGLKVQSATNAFPLWRSRLVPLADGMAAERPPSGLFASFVQETAFFSHYTGAPIAVQRFSIGSSVDLVLKDASTGTKEERHQELTYVDASGARSAIGFDQIVDGIRFRVTIGDDAVQKALSGGSLRSLRNLYFKHRLATDERLTCRLNTFALGALAEVFAAMVLARAMRSETSLSDAIDWLAERGDRWGRLAEETMFPLFGMNQQAPPTSDDEDEDYQATMSGPRLYGRLRPLFEDAEVRQALIQNSQFLHEPPCDDWREWTRRHIKSALAGALLQACIRSVADLTIDDLVVDIDNVDASADAGDIWITEPVIGGGGVIEGVMAAYTRDPRRFFLLAEMSAQTTDLESADLSLSRALELANEENHPIAGLMQSIRQYRSYEYSVQFQTELRRLLRQYGLQQNHPFMVALNARVLRPGSTSDWDRILRRMLDDWSAWEAKHGIEIDLRTVAYIEAVTAESSEEVRDFLAKINVPAQINDAFRVLSTTLWPRGYAIRRGALEFYTRFSGSLAPDPLVLRALSDVSDHIDVTTADWKHRAAVALRESGVVPLFAPYDRCDRLQEAVLELLCTPVDDGARHLYPHASHAASNHLGATVTLHIREAKQ